MAIMGRTVLFVILGALSGLVFVGLPVWYKFGYENAVVGKSFVLSHAEAEVYCRQITLNSTVVSVGTSTPPAPACPSPVPCPDVPPCPTIEPPPPPPPPALNLSYCTADPCGNFSSTKRNFKVLFEGNDWMPEHHYLKTQDCGCGIQCEWTHDGGAASTADAIVVMHRRSAPAPAFPGQVRAYLELESPDNGLWLTPKPAFDWKITYELDSDVPATYIEPGDPTVDLFPDVVKSNDYLVSALISHCVGDRLPFIEELSKHIKVHSMGKCLNNANSAELFKDCGDAHWHRTKRCIMSKFKFYLAMENSHYKDYVTEKLFWALESSTIPIYSGPPNAKDFMPGAHSIIFVEDFSSPKELADYLHFLANNTKLYNEYFEWRKRPLYPIYQRLLDHGWQNIYCNVCRELSRKAKLEGQL
eukprot:TRINITY_DN4396_c0_g1_i3.p1 TRINITY_DN4396_c0_g1~~TRINITY_DN4396_c0_g1_i3.p1  ORF type:complete len:415 (+),score=104.99 TRINITY_DN4396_c0_g1_i3:68-1312(+)